MDENPPVDAGDTGSIPGLERFHTPQGNWANEPQLLSPCAATSEAHRPRAHTPQQDKPPQWEALTLQQRVAPTHHNQRKPVHSNRDPVQPK